jgi:hypothetical protein
MKPQLRHVPWSQLKVELRNMSPWSPIIGCCLGTRPTGCRPPFQWFDSTLICEDRQWRNLELLRCQIKGDQRQQIDDLDRTRPQEGRRPTSFFSRKGTTRERDLLHRPPTLPSIFPSLSPNLGMGSQVHRTQLPFQAPLMAYQRRSPLESPRQCPRDVANGNHLAASVDLAVEVTPKAPRMWMWGLPPLWVVAMVGNNNAERAAGGSRVCDG